MASKNCLVKDLEAVETLGTTSTICSDKTGTLTENRMTVSHVWFDNTMFDTRCQIDSRCNLLKSDQKSESWVALSRCARLCSRTEFMSKQEDVPLNNRKCFGDASETAILKYMEEIIGDVMGFRKTYPKVCEIPFNSTNKFHVTIHRQGSVSSPCPYLLCMKGAPERILERCSTMLVNDEERELDEKIKSDVCKSYQNLGRAGERVIGFCDYLLPQDCYGEDYRFDSEEINFPLSGFRFLGLMGIEDPPRVGVRQAVCKCRDSGIKVIMITGDHPTTAEAIAREVGIVTGQKRITADNVLQHSCDSQQHEEDEYAVLLGEDLHKIKNKELDYVLSHFDEIIFARTSPQQKLHIVEGCQRIGESVAVTGDGVNDSPALRQADIGVAMGVSGSDISKDASDIILLDDNFASIVTGVEEGRLLFDNLKKCIAFTLTKTMPEMLPFLAYVIMSIPLPLGPIKILFIDLVTTIPAISLSYEKAEIDVMKRKPRSRKTDKVVDCGLLLKVYFRAGVVQSLGAFFAYFVVMSQSGFKPSELLGVRGKWDDKAINDLKDSYGQEWTYRDRKRLETTSHTVYFAAVILLQSVNVICCKTRINSICKQGMQNAVLNISSVLILLISLAFVYIPGLNTVLQFVPIDWTWWTPAIPFALLMLLLDETRRYVLRSVSTSRSSWAWKELYW